MESNKIATDWPVRLSLREPSNGRTKPLQRSIELEMKDPTLRAVDIIFKTNKNNIWPV